MEGKELLKKIFPMAFTVKKDITTFVVVLLIQVGAGAVISGVTKLLSHIFLLGILIGIVGSMLVLYVTASIVLTVLDYFHVLK